MIATLGKISNHVLSVAAGMAAFLMTLFGFLMLGQLNQQVAASFVIGLMALMVVWVAAEKPNGRQARAVAALIDRLLSVGRGDLSSPAPPILQCEMPALAAAVDGLFEQVRSNLDSAHAMALYDPVTSLPNRVYFRREADRVLKARHAEDRTALLFIDLDGFKEVNDRLGHAQGDQVLIMVANRLRVVVKAEGCSTTLAQPLLARLAGDEFTILLPDVGSRDEAERIAERALTALSEPFRAAEQTISLGASIGVALCPDHGADLTALMKAADIAMYHAKACGRSRMCFYEAHLAQASEQKAEREAGLRRAVDAGELALLFDPQFCLRTGAILGAEARLRWNDPLPDECLTAMAEECGLALRLGDWAVEQAGQVLARWKAAGLNHRLSLAIGARQLERADAFDKLRSALSGAGPPPWTLELHIGEDVLASCDVRILAELDRLRRDGVTIALAGFGSGGGSGLARLGELPLDAVRLSPALIGGIDRSAGARTIVSSVIHMIHGLGCAAVAEEACRQEQVEMLRTMGCDRIQGFPGGEPMAEQAFIAWAAAQDCESSLARAS